jgi:hypothetical protein
MLPLDLKIVEHQNILVEAYVPFHDRNTLMNSARFHIILCVCSMYALPFYVHVIFIIKGRKDPNPVDITRSNSLPQVHISQ